MKRHKKSLMAVCAALALMCVAGLVFMLLGNFGAGLSLWVMPMILGGMLLYILKRQSEAEQPPQTLPENEEPEKKEH